jgi:dihydrofolate synthase/folylpolyglutamate synthase
MQAVLTSLEWLSGLEFHGIKLGLENITRLLTLAGNPHYAWRSVHVAGTNGKGSVVAFVDTMLRAAGLKVGRFTSPHLCDIRERFIVNGALISPRELEDDAEFFRAATESWEHPPTFFEVNTAIAFRHFQRHAVDIAVVEVGMGGRFDSTNIITPWATAITNIALEHTKYLGDTLEAIAFEKAGILKPGVPMVCAETAPGPGWVIRARAEELACPIRWLGEDFQFTLKNGEFRYESERLSLGPVALGLAGAFQGANAAVAVGLAELVREHIPALDDAAMAAGLREAKWPCRLEQVLDSPPVIVDVAHNPAGIRELARSLSGPHVVVLAVAADKNAAEMVEAVKPLARPLILTQFTGRRALPADALCAAAGGSDHLRVDTLEEAIRAGMGLASKNTPLLIAGSLFTAGEARRILIEQYGAAPLRF